LSNELSTFAAIIGTPPRRLTVRVFDDGNIEIRAFMRDANGNYGIDPTDTMSLHRSDVDELIGALREAVRLADSR
jgi:hypothetical protein